MKRRHIKQLSPNIHYPYVNKYQFTDKRRIRQSSCNLKIKLEITSFFHKLNTTSSSEGCLITIYNISRHMKKKIKPVIQLLIFVLLLQHLHYLLVVNYSSDTVDHYDYRLELIAQKVEQLLVLDYSDFLVLVYFDCHFQMDYIPQDLFVYYLYFLQLVVWLDPIILIFFFVV